MALSTADPEAPLTCGATLCSGEPTDGRVLDVTAYGAGIGGATIRYRFEGDNPDALRIVATLDGRPAATTGASDGEIHFPAPGAGDHRLVVRTQREHFENFIDTAGDLDGRRAILRWAAVTSADLESYNVWRNNGAGGSTYTLIANVSEIVPDTTFRVAPTSGTGEGVITIGGSFAGTPPVNQAWRILIGAGATTFQVDPGTGSYGAALALHPGVETDIGSGLTVLFDSDSGAFVAADRWDFRLGPAREFVTAELEPGTYLFKISSVDSAGNESALSSATTVIVDPAPRAPTGFAATYASGTNTFTFTWTDPTDSDLAAIEIYTDYSNDFGDLSEGEIIFDSPVASVGDGVETATFTPAITAPEGTYRFVARARDNDGRRSDNVDAISVVLPVSSVGIGVPGNIVVTPGPAGVFVIDWVYNSSAGVATHFDIYVNTSSSSPSFASALASPAATPSAGVYPQSYTTGGYSHGATRYFTVRARNATLTLASVNVDLTAGTADATAPTAPSAPEGLPQ